MSPGPNVVSHLAVTHTLAFHSAALHLSAPPQGTEGCPRLEETSVLTYPASLCSCPFEGLTRASCHFGRNFSEATAMC